MVGVAANAEINWFECSSVLLLSRLELFGPLKFLSLSAIIISGVLWTWGVRTIFFDDCIIYQDIRKTKFGP